jgi:hypothetical protein
VAAGKGKQEGDCTWSEWFSNKRRTLLKIDNTVIRLLVMYTVKM